MVGLITTLIDLRVYLIVPALVFLVVPDLAFNKSKMLAMKHASHCKQLDFAYCPTPRLLVKRAHQ